MNTDREFGLALLQFLADEMRRRAEAAKAHEVSKLEELREADPTPGRWPRILAVIDEFQYLFGEKDAITKTATALLEDVARRGRSQGIHLVLASQDVSGIAAFWGRQAIFEQFVLRIALPRARAVLDKANDAALALPRWHAVVNHDSGIRYGNEIVRIPDASAKGPVDDVKKRVFERRDRDARPPRLFDGSRAPQYAELADRFGPDNDVPLALVGQCMDVDGSPATARLPSSPGRNLAVLGPGGWRTGSATACTAWSGASSARASWSWRATSTPGSPERSDPRPSWCCTAPTPSTRCWTAPAWTRCGRCCTSARRPACTSWAGGAACSGCAPC
jgi:hypothetical protein